MSQVINALISVAIGVGLATLLFVGGNLVLDQVSTRYWMFTAAIGATVGMAGGAIAQHNGWLPDGIVGIAIGMAVGAGIGAAYGAQRGTNSENGMGERLRPVVFLGPALLFVAMGLVFPALRTLVLSLRGGRRGNEPWTLDNYETIFVGRGDGRSSEFFNVDNFGDIFTSRLFIVGLATLAAGTALAWASANVNASSSTASLAGTISKVLRIAGVGLAFAVIAGFVEALVRDPNESTIFDVLTVIVSSRVSLLVAVVAALAAFALIFTNRSTTSGNGLDFGNPSSTMLVSGAVVLMLFAMFSTMQAVIWNNLWWVVTVAGLSTALGLLLAVLSERSRGERVAKALIFLPMAISMVGAAVIWDFVYERQPTGNETGLVNSLLVNMGFQPRGFFFNADLIPWNNFFIMLIMVWIQTGFAMVIISAAIKGVPDELLESARVDGATEVQTFSKIVLPQIRSTLVVVVTTLVVVVTKVFDLVNTTTGGANQTDVLANVMFEQLSEAGNFTLASAFAVVLFLLVLPVMIYNVRSTQKELG